MKWAVYWVPNEETKCMFFTTEAEARGHIDYLLSSYGSGASTWDITLLEVRAEVRMTLRLEESNA